MDAAAWDERYRSAPLVWSAGPNALFAELTAALAPGRALDVAAGEGRTAIWLASRGWQVTAMDFSAVGLDKGRRRARAAEVEVAWVHADITASDLPLASYDLVAVLFLHLLEPAVTEVLLRCAAAVAPGGTLVVIGHDRSNIDSGVGGPQNPALLYDTELLAGAADGLEVLRCEQVPRPTEAGVAIDTLLLARQPRQTRQARQT